MDRLGHTNSFLAQLLSAPVAPLERTLGERSSGIIRINISIRSLQKEAKRLAVECRFHCLRHRANVTCGIFQIVSAKDDRMACIIHENGEWGAAAIVNAHHQYSWVQRRGRLFNWIRPQHRDRMIWVHYPSVVANVNFAASSSNLRLH